MFESEQPLASSLQVDNPISEWGLRRGTGDGRSSCNPGGILGEARFARSSSRCTAGERGNHQNEMPAPRVFCRLLLAWLGLVPAFSGLVAVRGILPDALTVTSSHLIRPTRP